MARYAFAAGLGEIWTRMAGVAVGYVVYSGQREHIVKTGNVPTDGIGVVAFCAIHGVARGVVIRFGRSNEIVVVARATF